MTLECPNCDSKTNNGTAMQSYSNVETGSLVAESIHRVGECGPNGLIAHSEKSNA